MFLVTGATGSVGGRLVPRLLEAGRSVRVLVRDPARVAGRSWASRVEVAYDRRVADRAGGPETPQASGSAP